MILNSISNYMKIKYLERKTNMKKEKKDMRHNKRLTQKDFDTYKQLLGLGKSIKWVSEVVDRSYFTINMVNKSEDFDDYRRRIKEWGKPKIETARVQEITPAETEVADPGEGKFLTSDFYLSVTLRSVGVNCTGHTKLDGKSTFEFAITPTEANAIINQYYNREIMVNAFDFVTAIHEFKDRIHEISQ